MSASLSTPVSAAMRVSALICVVADHRRLVEDQHGAAEGTPCFLRPLGRGDTVAHVAVAREEPLQRAGRDVGLAFEHARGASRGGEADRAACSPASSLTVRSMVVLPEPAWPCTPTVQMRREQDRACGVALAGVEPGLAQLRLYRLGRRQAIDRRQGRRACRRRCRARRCAPGR